jgi:hypothetical protein
MALVLNQPLTEMSTWKLVRKADNLTAIYTTIV